MPRLLPLLAALLLALAAPQARADALSDGIGYMNQGAQAFQAGQRDQATFLFYLGQLRARAWLAAHPEADPSGPPAAFGALFATLGPPINEWAFGDIPALASILDQVLAWDAAHPDPSLPRGAVATTRAGLTDMRDQMLRDAASIRAQRSANGLPNR